jgi:hypothetical protein
MRKSMATKGTLRKIKKPSIALEILIIGMVGYLFFCVMFAATFYAVSTYLFLL